MARVWLRRAFWKNFGTSLDVAWGTWPEQEFHDTVSVLNAEAQAERSKHGAGSVSPDVTQATFDALPRVTREEQQQPSPDM